MILYTHTNTRGSSDYRCQTTNYGHNLYFKTEWLQPISQLPCATRIRYATQYAKVVIYQSDFIWGLDT